MKNILSLLTLLLSSGMILGQIQTQNPASGFGPMVPSTPGTPVGLILTQDMLTGNGTPSQNFEAAFDIYDIEAADDFIIPAGNPRSVVSIQPTFTTSLGSAFPSAGCDVVDMFIFEDAGGLPGALIFTESFTVTSLTPLMESTTCPPLDPGTYWVSLQTNMGFGACGQSFWSTTTDGDAGTGAWAVRNLGGGFGCPDAASGWADGANVCGFAGGTGPGLSMILSLSEEIAPAEIVPTMGEWGIMSLSILMMIFGTVAMRQRQFAF